MSSDKPVHPKERLRAAVQSGKIPHAMLFAGPGQMAAADAAKELAALLFCRASEKARPCGECAACRLLAAGSHPDARWISPEDSGVIKIDAIRELVREASLKPYQESKRVFVIERAEAMNEHAQNALLKNLEEPAGPSHFVLLAETPEMLLPTVRSRVQRLFFPDDARFSEAAEEEEAARKEALDYLLGQSARRPDWLSWERAAVLRVLDSVLCDLRDVLMMVSGAAELSRAEHRSFKERAARETDADTLLELMDKISSFKESIRQNASLKLALTVLWSETAPKNMHPAGQE